MQSQSDKILSVSLLSSRGIPFEIITDGRCLVITPVREEAEERKFQQALEKVHRRFGRAMKKLAE